MNLTAPTTQNPTTTPDPTQSPVQPAQGVQAPDSSQTDYSKATFNPQYQQKMPQIKQTVQQLRNQGIGDDKIMSYLVSKGVYQMPAAAPVTPTAQPSEIGAIEDVAGGLASRIGGTLNQGGQKVTKDIENGPALAEAAGGGKQNGVAGIIPSVAAAGSTLGHIAGDVAGTAGGLIGDVVAPLLPDSVKSKLGDVAGTINQKISQIPGMTPEIQKSMGDVFNSLGLLGGAEAEPAVAGAASKAVETASKIIPETTEVVPKVADASEAISRVTPEFEGSSASTKIKLAAQSTDRVKPGGIFKGPSVVPNITETEAGTELSKVPGYSSKLSNLETHNLIKNQIANEAKSMRSSLAKETAQVSPSEITKTVKAAVDGASKDSLLLDNSEPIVGKYMKVAQNAANKSDGSLEGVLNTRQALDDAYYNTRGKMAYGDTRINSLDEVHKAARNSLNQLLHDNAVGTDVKASLKRQSNLYRADDGVLPKIAKEGGSSIERFAKSHPKLTKAAKRGALIGASAIGGGEVVKHL